MKWINVKDEMPEQYKEVIIASNEGIVKSAVYMGNGKWNTFLPVAYWMAYPSPPDGPSHIEIEETKKKRGRPKKV